MKINFFMAIAIAAVTSLTINAQPQGMRPYSGLNPETVRLVTLPDGDDMLVSRLNLNDQQREEMKKIRTEQLKERTQTRNLLREKRAKLEVLQTDEKPDMKAINKLIDEIAAVQAQEMKNQAATRQKIRSLLNEEQRVRFDAQGGNFGNMRTDGENRPRQQIRPESGNFRGQRPAFRPENESFRGQRFEFRPQIEGPRGQRMERPLRLQEEKPER